MDLFSHLNRYKLRSADRLTQLNAAYELARTGDGEAIEILREALLTGNWQAVQILNEINFKPQTAYERALFHIYHGRFQSAIEEGAAAGKALYESLLWPKDNREQKLQTIQALAQIKAIEELIYYLYQLGKNVALVEYRVDVCRKLGELGDPRAVSVLLSELEIHLQGIPSVADCPPSVAHLSRRMAAWALGEIGDSRALSGLMKSALRVDDGSLASIEAIQKIAGTRKAVEVLTGLLLQSTEVACDPEIVASAVQKICEWVSGPYEYAACSFAFAVMEAAQDIRQASYEAMVQGLRADRLSQLLSAGEETVSMLERVLEMGRTHANSFSVPAYERLAVMLLVYINDARSVEVLKRIAMDPAGKGELKKLAAHVLGSRLFASI